MHMRSEYLVSACSGAAIHVKEGQFITVIDIEGEQVADFFAEAGQNPNDICQPE